MYEMTCSSCNIERMRDVNQCDANLLTKFKCKTSWWSAHQQRSNHIQRCNNMQAIAVYSVHREHKTVAEKCNNPGVIVCSKNG